MRTEITASFNEMENDYGAEIHEEIFVQKRRWGNRDEAQDWARVKTESVKVQKWVKVKG